MEIVLGTIVFLVGAGLTTAFGLARIDPQGFSRSRADEREPPSPPRPMLATAPAFVPLELAGLGMPWPSEQPFLKPRLRELPWPSQTWTDNFFTRPGDSPYAPPMPETEAEDAARRAQIAKAAPRQPHERSAPPRQTSKLKRVEVEASAAGPSHAEVARMVQELGLAGAVDEVRKRTGWDFQKSAQYLAQALREAREGRS